MRLALTVIIAASPLAAIAQPLPGSQIDATASQIQKLMKNYCDTASGAYCAQFNIDATSSINRCRDLSGDAMNIISEVGFGYPDEMILNNARSSEAESILQKARSAPKGQSPTDFSDQIVEECLENALADASAKAGKDIAATISSAPDPAFDYWRSLPENADLQEACSNELTYGAAIASARKNGADMNAVLRWAEQESEKVASKMPNEPMIGVATDEKLLELIQHYSSDGSLYSRVQGASRSGHTDPA